MRTLKFTGHSDDVFCVEGGKADNETYLSNDSTGAYKVGNEHAGLFVVGIYAPDATSVGCWSVGVSPLDENVPLPDWPTRFEMAGNGYSPSLVIEVPDDAYVAPVNNEG